MPCKSIVYKAFSFLVDNVVDILVETRWQAGKKKPFAPNRKRKNGRLRSIPGTNGTPKIDFKKRSGGGTPAFSFFGLVS
jgi:hypothetical protein